MPLIYELTNLNFDFNIRNFTPYLTVIVAILLVSKIPTLALKKISTSQKTTVFLLLSIGFKFLSTFELIISFK